MSPAPHEVKADALYAHINWGGRFRLSVDGDTLVVRVFRWGGGIPGLTMKSVGWKKVETLDIHDLMYFYEV